MPGRVTYVSLNRMTTEAHGYMTKLGEMFLAFKQEHPTHGYEV